MGQDVSGERWLIGYSLVPTLQKKITPILIPMSIKFAHKEFPE